MRTARSRFLPMTLFALAAAAWGPPARAGEKENEAVERAFKDAYSLSADEKSRAKAVESLASAPPSVAVDLILGRVLPKDTSAMVQTAALKVLRGLKDEKAVKEMVAVAQAKGEWSVRGPVLEALGGVEGAVAAEGLVRVLGDSDPRVLAAALFALAERHPGEALEKVKPLLRNGAWQVRLGAAEYLAALGDRSMVLPLVDRLDEETGRLREDFADALKRLTGKDYGADAAKWRAYAAGGEAAVKALDPGASPGGAGGAPGGPAPSRNDTTSTTVEKETPLYYGLKVYSDRVVFVIDVSLSMLEEMVIDKERMIRETGAVTSGSDADAARGAKKQDEEVQGLEWWKIRTRMDFARAQTKFVVQRLKKDQQFDMVWFSDSVVAWQGGFVPATPGNKVKAAAWIEELKPEAGTNSWGGLMKAYNLVGRGGTEENFRRGADTVYFLSDGEPSVGDIKDKDQILAAIERIHAVRRVKIHVIQIGTSPMPFMKRLASITGGEYRFWNSKKPG